MWCSEMWALARLNKFLLLSTELFFIGMKACFNSSPEQFLNRVFLPENYIINPTIGCKTDETLDRFWQISEYPNPR